MTMGDGESYANGQLEWYRRALTRDRTIFIAVSTLKLFLAASIPVIALLPLPDWSKLLMAIFGALIVFLEGLDAAGQYRASWARNAITAENILAEITLAKVRAGDYAYASNSDALLAVRISRLVKNETANWWAQTDESSSTAVANSK